MKQVGAGDRSQLGLEPGEIGGQQRGSDLDHGRIAVRSMPHAGRYVPVDVVVVVAGAVAAGTGGTGATGGSGAGTGAKPPSSCRETTTEIASRVLTGAPRSGYCRM